MYIKDCITLLSKGFTVDEIRSMSKEPEEEKKREEKKEDAPEDKKPEPEKKDQEEIDYKALHEKDLQTIDKLQKDLKEAQSVNRSAGTAEIKLNEDLQKKLNDILVGGK